MMKSSGGEAFEFRENSTSAHVIIVKVS